MFPYPKEYPQLQPSPKVANHWGYQGVEKCATGFGSGCTLLRVSLLLLVYVFGVY